MVELHVFGLAGCQHEDFYLAYGYRKYWRQQPQPVLGDRFLDEVFKAQDEAESLEA
jgi:hypothetical protein